MNKIQFRDVATNDYLLRSKEKDLAGRQDIFEVYICNSHFNKYKIKSIFTGMELEVYGNELVSLKYEVLKRID